MEVVRFTLSSNVSSNATTSATDAAKGMNVANADVQSRLEDGATALAAKGLESVGGVCCDYSGNIYVSDPEMHVIMKIDEGGRLTTFAGQAGTSGRNGTLTNIVETENNPVARFNTPRGLACDKSGNIYVADSGNNQIRVIKPNGRVSHVAGNGNGTAGRVNSTNGDGGVAMFNNPVDVAVDASGVVYVCDKGNHAIRSIKGGNVLTIAGSGSAGDQAGEQVFGGVNSCLNSPNAIAVDSEGNIMICDSGNYKIKKLTPRGFLYRHSGSGTKGRGLGTDVGNSKAYTCQYVDLRYCACDRSGNMYVVDRGNASLASRILKINYIGAPGVIADFNEASSYNETALGIAVTPAQKLFVTFASESELGSSSSSS